MNTSAKGSRVERRVQDILEWDGFFVIKAGGSKGACDLVALDNACVVAISVKSSYWFPKQIAEEIKAMMRVKGPRLARWIIRWPDRKPPMIYVVREDGTLADPGEWLTYVRWKRAQQACASHPTGRPGPSAASAPSRSAQGSP